MASNAPVSNGNGSSAIAFDGNAESSKIMAGEIDPVFHAINLARGIFNVGYLNQEWSDIQLTFFSSAMKGHRLILSRSPYLAQIMSSTTPGSTIQLPITDGNITEESVHIALQHIYNPSLNLVGINNARSVLAAAFLFGGMPELVHHAYLVIRDSLDSTNVIETVYWLGASPESAVAFTKPVNGKALDHKGQESVIATWLREPSPRYGEWTIRLKHDVMDYLLRVLPGQVHEAGKLSDPDSPLLAAYAPLPYELFKYLVESPELPIASHQDRFSFAKKVIAQRKKSASGGGQSMEENVVLAFRGGEGMEVHVTRRPKKGRTFYKVEG